MSDLEDFLGRYGADRPVFEVELPAVADSEGPGSPFVIIRCGDRTIIVNPMVTHANKADGGPVVSVDVHTWVAGELHASRVHGFGSVGGVGWLGELEGRHCLSAVIVGDES